MLIPQSKNQGFTLIELVVVIIILGILAVVAAPKFIDLGSDAKAAALDGLAGAMKSAASTQHTKALVNKDSGGLENGFISDGILFDQGYPIALDYDTPGSNFGTGDGVPEIIEAMELDLDEWTFNTERNGSENGEITRELYITLRDVIGDGATVAEIIATNCYLSYDSYLLVPEAPVTRVITTGC